MLPNLKKTSMSTRQTSTNKHNLPLMLDKNRTHVNPGFIILALVFIAGFVVVGLGLIGNRTQTNSVQVESEYTNFTQAQNILIGDRIYIQQDKTLVPDIVTSIEKVLKPTQVYNISVDSNKTFFAEGVAVHNKLVDTAFNGTVFAYNTGTLRWGPGTVSCANRIGVNISHTKGGVNWQTPSEGPYFESNKFTGETTATLSIPSGCGYHCSNTTWNLHNYKTNTDISGSGCSATFTHEQCDGCPYDIMFGLGFTMGREASCQNPPGDTAKYVLCKDAGDTADATDVTTDKNYTEVTSCTAAKCEYVRRCGDACNYTESNKDAINLYCNSQVSAGIISSCGAGKMWAGSIACTRAKGIASGVCEPGGPPYWNGTACVSPNCTCTCVNAITVQGFKQMRDPIGHRGSPISGLTVTCEDGTSSLTSTANSYAFTTLKANSSTTCSVAVPANLNMDVWYSKCPDNSIACHSNGGTTETNYAPYLVNSSSATFTTPASGYVDLWWHFKCKTGYVWDGSACIIPTCGDTIPWGAQAHDREESEDPPLGTDWTFSATDTATKCQYKYVCGGTIPSGAQAYDTEESNDLTSATDWTLSVSDTATKCQYKYICGGTPSTDPYAQQCSGDDTGLTGVTNWSVKTDCTTTKCEYECLDGYLWDGSACVPVTCGGVLPKYGEAEGTYEVYGADENTVPVLEGTQWNYQDTDTSAKCEYGCKLGYKRVGTACVAEAPYCQITSTPSSGNTNTIFTFNAILGGGNGTYILNWQNPYGTPATYNANPFTDVNFPNTGTWTISLDVVSNGLTATCTKDMAITSAIACPVADFSIEPVSASGTTSTTFIFTDTSTNGPEKWWWDFETDGTVDATTQNSSKRYSTEGTKKVTLKVDKIGCAASEISKDVAVGVTPAQIVGYVWYDRNQNGFQDCRRGSTGGCDCGTNPIGTCKSYPLDSGMSECCWPYQVDINKNGTFEADERIDTDSWKFYLSTDSGISSDHTGYGGYYVLPLPSGSYGNYEVYLKFDLFENHSAYVRSISPYYSTSPKTAIAYNQTTAYTLSELPHKTAWASSAGSGRADFGVSAFPPPTPAVPWWQIGSGNVHTDTTLGSASIQSILPSGESFITGGGAASWNEGNAPSLGENGSIGSGLEVQSGEYQGRKFTYDYWQTKQLADYLIPLNGSTGSIDLALLKNGIYEVEATDSISEIKLYASNVIENEIAILFNKDIRITTNILASSTGIVVAIAKGSIWFNYESTYQVTEAHGFFIADGEIYTDESNNSSTEIPVDVQLQIKGGLISWKGVNLWRDLGEVVNKNTPGEKFMQNTEMVNRLKNTSSDLKAFKIYQYTWQEVAP